MHAMKTLILALVLAVAGTVLGIAPASASDEPHTRVPRVTIPAFEYYPSGPVDITIQGQTNTMRFAHRAWQITRQVPGLRLHLHTTCAARPYDYCVTVHRVNRPRVNWWGVTQYGRRNTVSITLNMAFGASPATAAHEYMHALGMQHHLGPGILNWPTEKSEPMSPAELRALRKAYP